MGRRTLGVLWPCLLILAVGAGLAQAAPNVEGVQEVLSDEPRASIRFVPEHGEITPGESITVAMRIYNVVDVYGAEVRVEFDPNLLSVEDAQRTIPGVQIAPGDLFPGVSPFVNIVDNYQGIIRYTISLTDPAPPVSGDKTLATITFVGRRPGKGSVTFAYVAMLRRGAVPFPFDIGAPAEITVRSWQRAYLPLALRNR